MHLLLLLLLAAPALLLGWAHASGDEPSRVTLSTGGIFQELMQQANPQPVQRMRGQTNSTGTSPLDALIDFLLAGAVPLIISHGKPALPIPDFSFHVNATLGGEFRMVSDMKASGGSLQNFKSLFRQGPAVLRRAQGGVLLLEAAAGIRMLRLSYSKYTVTLNGPLATGQIEMDVSPAAMSAQLTLTPPCMVHLRQLQMSQLGALHIRVTGLPDAFSSLPKMVENLFQYPGVRQAIAGAAVQRVAGIITQELKRLSCK